MGIHKDKLLYGKEMYLACLKDAEARAKTDHHTSYDIALLFLEDEVLRLKTLLIQQNDLIVKMKGKGK